MTSTAIAAKTGGVITIIQTVRASVGERSSREDGNQEYENRDFVVRHLKKRACVDSELSSGFQH